MAQANVILLQFFTVNTIVHCVRFIIISQFLQFSKLITSGSRSSGQRVLHCLLIILTAQYLDVEFLWHFTVFLCIHIIQLEKAFCPTHCLKLHLM